MRPRLCIIVPVLNEAAGIAAHLGRLQGLRERGAHVVVVDGGSSDDTLSVARRHADLALIAPRGRAAQMNAGAAACPAEVLLFLHADTVLPEGAEEKVLLACRAADAWGRFDVRIPSPRPLLGWVARLMNWRSRLTGIATGDQTLFVRNELFERVGGFPELPLMEDIAICKQLKRFSHPHCLRDKVETSARRWERHGVWRTIFLMWRLRAAYYFGADPNRLAILYGYRPRHDA